MSQPTPSEVDVSAELAHLEKLCTSIRGKLQFMDYLVRAALADAERFQNEPEEGTRFFLRQLVEMHATNLSLECENMRLVGEFGSALDSVLNGEPAELIERGYQP